MTPCAHSHSTRSGVLWPVRLSHTSTSRSGGRSCGKLKGIVRPACHTAQAARVAAASCEAAGTGSAARIALSCSRSHGCSTALVPRAAGYSRTRPDAGWNRVRILLVPPRMYSCGCWAPDHPAWWCAPLSPAECVVHLGRSYPREDPSCTGLVPTAKTTLNPAHVRPERRALHNEPQLDDTIRPSQSTC